MDVSAANVSHSHIFWETMFPNYMHYREYLTGMHCQHPGYHHFAIAGPKNHGCDGKTRHFVCVWAARHRLFQAPLECVVHASK